MSATPAAPPARPGLVARLAAPAPIDPYRLLFPLGACYAIAGAAPWILHAGGVIPYPAALHRALMIEGFELAFVLGFLLTALPGLTHGERCRSWELAAALAAAIGVGAGALSGRLAIAHASFAAGILLLAIAAGRRVLAAKVRPPEEFVFVGLGLAMGLASGVLQTLAAAGAWSNPAPQFAARLGSLGMVLCLVVGVGALLVPVFAGIRDPLVIPGVAAPHERGGRRALYSGIALAFAGAFAFEGTGHARVGAVVRAAAATVMVAWVWKLIRLPARRTRSAFAMWTAGWCVALGLWLAAAIPAHAVAALHVTFAGGFGLLTLAIASRVVTSHGGHPLPHEERLVSPGVLAALGAAVILRALADALPGAALLHTLGTSAAVWTLAWLVWAFRAFARARA